MHFLNQFCHFLTKNEPIFLWNEECIPVGCVPPALYHSGVSLTESSRGQRPPLDTDPLLDTEPPDIYPPGQRPPYRDLLPWTEILLPWIETPSPGQRPLWTKKTPVDRQTDVKILPCPKLRLRVVIKFWFVWLNYETQVQKGTRGSTPDKFYQCHVRESRIYK